jgi:hypothetical protein
MRIKIASITGDSARLIAKAQEDTGQVIFKDNSTISARKILDVFIENRGLLYRIDKRVV